MAIKIYIDQGHNPRSPNTGAEGNGLREQDITYEVGTRLAELLRRNGNFDVRVSRPTPTTQLGTSNASSLRARVDDANSWGADYFISIHTNASSQASANGTEVLVYSQPSISANSPSNSLARIPSSSVKSSFI
jgi:N-acetylmuramoyl-L-alanine amidase